MDLQGLNLLTVAKVLENVGAPSLLSALSCLQLGQVS